MMDRRTALVALALALLAPFALAQKKEKSEKPSKPATYAVVQNGESKTVVEMSQIAAMRKQAQAAYKTALDKYKTEKRLAAKRKEKFNEPKPKKPTFKVLRKGFKKMADAQAFLAKQSKRKSATKSKRAQKGKRKKADKDGDDGL